MKVSRLFGTTLRETSTKTDIESYLLLERAGYVRQLSSGIFSYLHLAQRSLQKIERILREEMDRIGGVEISMPVVHPADIWKKTGRFEAIDDSLVRWQDRFERDMVLAMTHEEVVGDLARTEVSSYKQMPLLIYQLQTKFRDEIRPRGGLLRVREFIMKDSYSMDTDWDGLRQQYVNHYDAYYRMFARMGLQVAAVLSDSGMMGGDMAHEYHYFNEIGEDSIFVCNGCGYKANKEIAGFQRDFPEKVAPAEIEKVHTPAAKTIADLSEMMGLPLSAFAKMVFFAGEFPGEDGPVTKVVAAIVRGDMEANPIKINKVVKKVSGLRAATEAEIKAAGAEPGFASPIGMDKAKTFVVADLLIAKGSNWVIGANETDYHLKNVNVGRDFKCNDVGDISNAYEGAGCPKCGTALEVHRGVEAGNIFQLGTKYSEALGATFMNEGGREEPIIMGSYGIGVGRALACLVQEFRDDDGLMLPITVAPYHVYFVAIGSPEIEADADKLYDEMIAAGIEVLHDDRGRKVASPGVKFKDADLRGVPIRLTYSSRSLEKGGLEIKVRGEEDFQIVSREDTVSSLQATVERLEAAIRKLVEAQPTWESEKEFWK